MRQALALLLTVCLIAVGCGGARRGQPADKPVPAVTTLRLTRDVPSRVRALCRATRRQVGIAVTCPPLVPTGGVARDPNVTYADTYREAPDFYAMTVNSGEIPGTTHWIVGAGTPGLVNRYVLSSRDWDVKGPVETLGTARYAGRVVTLYHFPPEPAGGMYGGHVAAMTRVHGLVLFASVRGYRHSDADIAMLLAYANAAR